MTGTKVTFDPDSFVITNSWKVGHGGIIDPAALPMPMYHSAVAVPEAGVLVNYLTCHKKLHSIPWVL